MAKLTPLPDVLHGGEEPVRLLASEATLSPALRELLLSPPPVKPLEAHVAMRVRGAVLQTPAAAAATKSASLSSSQPLALAKLGVVAATAALLGAGVMTLVSGYVNAPSSQFGSASDRSGVVVVSAKHTPQTSRQGAWHASEAARLATSDARTNDTVAGSASPKNAAAVLGASIAPNELGRADSTSSAVVADRDDQNNPGAPRLQGDGLAERNPAFALVGGREVSASTEAALRGAGESEQAANTVFSVDDLAAADEDLFHRDMGRSASNDARVLVRPAFRHIASSSEAETNRAHRLRASTPRMMSSLEEETLLLEDARTKLGRDPENALTLALEHQSRFRRGQLLEQRRMIHLEALLRLGRDKEALDLAKSIGNSLYQARAQALLAKYGI